MSEQYVAASEHSQAYLALIILHTLYKTPGAPDGQSAPAPTY